VLLHTASVHEGKYVSVFESAADVELLVAHACIAGVRPGLFRLGAVQPEGVPALRKELAHQLIPEEIAGRGIGGVVGLRLFELEALALHGFEVLRLRVHQGPDRDHGVDMLVVQGLQLGGHVSVLVVEYRIALAAGLPPVPVLNNGVHGNVAGAVLSRISACDL